MSSVRTYIKENEKAFCLGVSALACAVYFCFLLRFYLIDYYVPDFRLYGSFAEQNFKAKDGFSSLFIWIAGISRVMPRAVTVGCLVLLAASIFNMLAFYVRSLYVSLRRFAFVLCMVLSCGSWYYFYGKIFYDFPFSAFTYSLCLARISLILEKQRAGKPFSGDWLALFALFGLTLSWKPYNVFMLAGLLLCALVKARTREIVLAQFSSLKKAMLSAASLCAGYVVGNFNLLVSPKATIKGILAYKASFPFREFLYGKHRIIWDHVNDLPFCVSVFSLTAMLILFVIVPLISGRKRYAAVFAVMFLLLRAYIKNFSPGYAWHGLVFGVFLLTVVLFVFSENTPFPKAARVLSALAAGIQLCVTFALYVPTQSRWHHATQESIAVLENQNSAILRDVESVVQGLGGKTFFIDEPIKRYRPELRSSPHIRKIGVRQPYIIYDDIWYPSPLENINTYDWERLYRRENSTQYRASKWNFHESTRFMVYVVPDPFKQLVDVADIFSYERFPCVSAVKGDGYTVYVYESDYKDPNDIDSVFDDAEDVSEPVDTF